MDEGDEPVDKGDDTTRVASVTNTLSSPTLADDKFESSSPTGTFSSPTAKIISFCNSSAFALSPRPKTRSKRKIRIKN